MFETKMLPNYLRSEIINKSSYTITFDCIAISNYLFFLANYSLYTIFIVELWLRFGFSVFSGMHFTKSNNKLLNIKSLTQDACLIF